MESPGAHNPTKECRRRGSGAAATEEPAPATEPATAAATGGTDPIPRIDLLPGLDSLSLEDPQQQQNRRRSDGVTTAEEDVTATSLPPPTAAAATSPPVVGQVLQPVINTFSPPPRRVPKKFDFFRGVPLVPSALLQPPPRPRSETREPETRDHHVSARGGHTDTTVFFRDEPVQFIQVFGEQDAIKNP